METANGSAHCDQCKRLSIRKHGRIAKEMHTLFLAISVFLVVFGRFLGVGHHLARGLPTCTRLKKMQAIACVKIGCPALKMVVLSPFFLLFFLSRWGRRGSVTQKQNKVNQALFMVDYGRFLELRNHLTSGLPFCTRLILCARPFALKWVVSLRRRSGINQ